MCMLQVQTRRLVPLGLGLGRLDSHLLLVFLLSLMQLHNLWLPLMQKPTHLPVPNSVASSVIVVVYRRELGGSAHNTDVVFR